MSAYTSLIKAYGAHSLVNVRRVLLEMKEDGVQPNQLHYRTAIVAHGACGRPQEAQVSIHQALLTNLPTAITCATFAAGFSTACIAWILPLLQSTLSASANSEPVASLWTVC